MFTLPRYAWGFLWLEQSSSHTSCRHQLQYTFFFLSNNVSKGVPLSGFLESKYSFTVVLALLQIARSRLSECLCFKGHNQEKYMLIACLFWKSFISNRFMLHWQFIKALFITVLTVSKICCKRSLSSNSRIS